MPTRLVCVVLAGFLLAGCAAATPAPRFSTVSPADAEAPEGTAPPAPALSVEAESREAPDPPDPADDTAAGDYTCTMHPEVRQATPGTCPRCGMHLVRRKGARP